MLMNWKVDKRYAEVFKCDIKNENLSPLNNYKTNVNRVQTAPLSGDICRLDYDPKCRQGINLISPSRTKLLTSGKIDIVATKCCETLHMTRESLVTIAVPLEVTNVNTNRLS
ncbi:hypothetical protein PHET_08634 [Paragonimus heterotremus]|uniref:Uncharacterized protein n=1 Tax=Paragonimus heterotremus TaxID=100268 RepID=A0A8J4T5Y7_9TREM|nr:hypothetical protein PHET_08634 [Paragonimus heterotremus]